MLSHLAANYLNAGWEAQRHGTAHASIVPYQGFVCQDGERIIVGAANDQFFHELCSVDTFHKNLRIIFSPIQIINMPELATNDLFKSNRLRVANREALISILSKK